MPARQHRQTRHLPAFILLVVAEGPQHGGAIHGALQQRLPGLKVDTGAVYRTLQAMEADGEVVSTWDVSAPGPARKVFSITDAGWQRLARWKQDIEHRMTLLGHFLTSYEHLAQRPR